MLTKPTELLGLAAGLVVWTGALFALRPGPVERATPVARAIMRAPHAALLVSAPATTPHAYPESTHVRGRVVDGDGNPVAGSAVIVCPLSLMSPPLPYAVVTDADGRFEVSGLAPGRYSFVAIHGQHPPGAVDAIPVFADESSPRLSSVEVEIVLDRDLVLEA